MSDPARQTMTSDAFIAWAMEQPAGRRYELSSGEVVAMAPERVAHARAKFRIARLMAEAVEAAGSACEVFTDGMAVTIDETTTYEPDAMVSCGSSLAPTATTVDNPVIVVEVLFPSTFVRDSTEKLENYFRIPSLHHYLIVKPETGAIIHHQRNPDGTLLPRITHSGPIHLDPPGITLTDPHPPRG